MKWKGLRTTLTDVCSTVLEKRDIYLCHTKNSRDLPPFLPGAFLRDRIQLLRRWSTSGCSIRTNLYYLVYKGRGENQKGKEESDLYPHRGSFDPGPTTDDTSGVMGSSPPSSRFHSQRRDTEGSGTLGPVQCPETTGPKGQTCSAKDGGVCRQPTICTRFTLDRPPSVRVSLPRPLSRCPGLVSVGPSSPTPRLSSRLSS